MSCHGNSRCTRCGIPGLEDARSLLRMFRSARGMVAGFVLLALTVAAGAQAQTTWPGGRWQPGAAAYGVQTVVGVPVPMKDGLSLDATISYPTDPATGQRLSSVPVIVQYTPYTADATPNSYFVMRGYIVAVVWARGTRSSPGVFTRQGPQERADGATIVDWASKLAESNGVVGMMGCSYRGNLALGSAAKVGPNSPLKAIVAACAGFEAFPREIFMRGGAITRTGAAIVAAGAGYGSPLALPFLQTLQDEVFAGGPAAFYGPFWEDRGTLEDARSVVGANVATLLWSTWSDITVSGAINTYTALQNAAVGRDVYAPMDPTLPASGRYQIIVGEGGHGANNDNAIWLLWFDTFLKNQDTGIDRVANTLHLRELTRWVNARTWPIVPTHEVQYLGTPGVLSPVLAAPTGNAPILKWDSRPENANGRLDYTTVPYPDGMLIAGPIAATVFATTSNTNLQLIASLYNVAPDGTATLIQDGVMVGSQRALDQGKSWWDSRGSAIRPVVTQASDAYLVPNQPYRFDILLQPRLWPVEAGHSLRLTLTTRVPASTPCAAALSSTPCYNTAAQLATLPGGVYTVLSGPAYPSSVSLPMLPRGHFATARSSTTSTSGSATIPMDWGAEKN